MSSPVFRAALALAGLLLVSNPGKAETSQPNIIVILADDMGWGDLGVFYQNSRTDDRKFATPMLDRFAKEGMQLRQHYCPAPVCAPSRASLLSGRHQGHEPIRDNQFDKALANSHTLASVLKTAGYRTGLVGKYGLPGGDRDKYDMAQYVAFPTKRGFDDFFGYVTHRDGHSQYPAHEYPRGDSELHRLPKPVFHNDQDVGPELTGCYTTDLFTAYAKKWIVDQKKSKPKLPFFLYLAYSTPHAAVQIPTMAYPEGGGLTGGVQWLGKPGHMINTASEPIDSWIHPDYAGKNWSEMDKRFATSVRRIDTCVGDLVQTLKDLGIDKDTFIVFTSDNGPHQESYIEGLTHEANDFDSFGPYNGIKRDVLEGGIREPTLVRWPGHIPAGALNQTPSQFHDWMPTFTNLAGMPGPALSDGVSLLPSLTGQGIAHESTVYVEYFQSGATPDYPEFDPKNQKRKRGQMQAVFMDGYKGIRTDIKSHDDDFEIYDLSNNPQESSNLADSSGYFKNLEQRMKDRVLQLRRPNESAPRPYDNVPVPGVDPAEFTDQVSWKVFKGKFPWTPQTADLTPSKEGHSESVSLSVSRQKNNIAIEFTGYIRIDNTGIYNWHLDSDSGAILRLHEAVVVDNESVIDGQRQTEGTILLERGIHPFTLIYSRANKGKPRLEFSYAPSE